MEKPEMVDDLGHTFLTEHGSYMVHSDDIEGNLINSFIT